MKGKLILASNNKHKIKEYSSILGKIGIDVISQKEAGIEIDAQETGTNFKENAIIKAEKIYEKIKKPVISDDSGLVIDFLNGMPGVYSHRFLGENTPDKEKCEKILEMMKDVQDDKRTARFVCDICYIDENGEKQVFEGVCEGKISDSIKGNNGFTYDMIFLYNDNKTFAQMSEEEKDNVSHRKKAVDKLLEYIKNNN